MHGSIGLVDIVLRGGLLETGRGESKGDVAPFLLSGPAQQSGKVLPMCPKEREIHDVQSGCGDCCWGVDFLHGD